MITLNIDRTTDAEVVIVTCTLNDVILADTYCFDIVKTDEEIMQIVRDDLIGKGYTIN